MIDYSYYYNKLALIELNDMELKCGVSLANLTKGEDYHPYSTDSEELRYNPYHDEAGKFCSAENSIDKTGNRVIINMKDTYIYRSVGAKAHNYEVEDKSTGEKFEFVEGTRIQSSKVFAGKGVKTPLHEETVAGLVKEFQGTNPQKWQHVKGIGTINYYGESRKAEVHWFQEQSVGKVKFKVKRWLE